MHVILKKKKKQQEKYTRLIIVFLQNNPEYTNRVFNGALNMYLYLFRSNTFKNVKSRENDNCIRVIISF